MKIHNPALYPARPRSTNIALIKAVVFAQSGQAFDEARVRFAENLHPSLFSELDWFEESGTPERARHVDRLFQENLQAILRQRTVEADVGMEPLLRMTDDVDTHLESTLALLTDRNRIPIVATVAIQNAVLAHLDDPTSRMRAKEWLRRREQSRLPNLPQLDLNDPAARDRFLDIIQTLGQDAAAERLPWLAASVGTLLRFLAKVDLAKLDGFDGDYICGVGVCERCSMRFASEAILSLDPTCPWLCKLEGDNIFVPEFNVVDCLFCGHRARTNSPALFYAPSRKQIIYCLPTLGQRTERDALDFYRPIIEEARRRCLQRLGPEGAAPFEQAAEVLTYDFGEFLAAIQLGHAVKEWHSWNIIRFADGSGLIADKTKNICIALTPEDLQRHWAAAGGGPGADVGGTSERTGGPGNDRATPSAPVGISEAKTAFEAGRTDEAQRILEQYLAANPTDSIARTNLATVYLKLGLRDRAKSLLSVARDSRPGS